MSCTLILKLPTIFHLTREILCRPD